MNEYLNVKNMTTVKSLCFKKYFVPYSNILDTP